MTRRVSRRCPETGFSSPRKKSESVPDTRRTRRVSWNMILPDLPVFSKNTGPYRGISGPRHVFFHAVKAPFQLCHYNLIRLNTTLVLAATITTYLPLTIRQFSDQREKELLVVRIRTSISALSQYITLNFFKYSLAERSSTARCLLT